jgi:hypothetical protein
VIIHAIGWVEDEFDEDGIEVFPDLEHIGGKGSGKTQGTLRQFAILVSFKLKFGFFRSTFIWRVWEGEGKERTS